MTGLAIVSGGMDSVTLAYALRQQDHAVDLLSIDYGQRHVREIDCARRAAEAMAAEHLVVSLPLGDLLTGSALTDSAVDVPEGHYEDETMRATVVPNRNAVMLAVAVAVAVARKYEFVATGVHAGDHAVYPDCRPEFITAFDYMERVATEGFAVPGFRVVAPFVNITKADIVRVGADIGVPFADTWSCYQGREFHCGKCGTCVERIEAFVLAGVTDPTVYEP